MLHDPPATVAYPDEPTYEEQVERKTQQPERDRQTQNAQLKVNWQNHSTTVDKIEKPYGDKPWTICVKKTVSMLCLFWLGKHDSSSIVIILIWKMRGKQPNNCGKRSRTFCSEYKDYSCVLYFNSREER